MKADVSAAKAKPTRRTVAQIQKQEAEYTKKAEELKEMEKKKQQLAAEMDLMLEANETKKRSAVIRHVSQVVVPEDNDTTHYRRGILEKDISEDSDSSMAGVDSPPDAADTSKPSDEEDAEVSDVDNGSDDEVGTSNMQRKVSRPRVSNDSC